MGLYPAGPGQVRVVLLLSCTRCQGEAFVPDEDEPEEHDLNVCPRCKDGWQLLALPLGAVLNAYRPEMSEAESWELIASLAEAGGPRHPDLYYPEKIPLRNAHDVVRRKPASPPTDPHQ